MKLRLPHTLRMALIAAMGIVSAQIGFAEYTNGSLAPDGKTGSTNGLYQTKSNGNIVYSSYESITFDSFITYGESNPMMGKYAPKGGVLLVQDGDIELSGNGTITVSNNSANGGGGAFYAESFIGYTPTIKINSNENVIFHKNKALGNNICGGALYSRAYVQMRGNERIEFSENEATSLGGAICSDSNVMMEGNADIILKDNIAKNGGAIYIGARVDPRIHVSFINNTGEIEISGNDATNGGAIYSRGSIVFTGNNSVKITANEASEHTGALWAQGGLVRFVNNNDILIEGNQSKRGGSAIHSANGIDLKNNRNVHILGNRSTEYGAALAFSIYTKGDTVILADAGNILFDGNISKGKRMAIQAFAESNDMTVDLGAFDGYSLTFKDAVVFGQAKIKPTQGLVIDMNATGQGDIIFSGENNGGEELKSYFGGKTNIYGGTLEIKDQASLNMQTVKIDVSYQAANEITTEFHDFNMKFDSVLAIYREAKLSAKNVTFDAGSTIRAGLGAEMTATGIDMSKGVIYDISQFLGNPNNLGSIADCGLTVNVDSWAMGGTIVLKDSNYAEDIWAESQRFLLFSDVKGTHGNAIFSGIMSMTGASDVIDGEQFAYHGYWTYDWDGNNFYAIWNATSTGDELWWDGNKPADNQWPGDGNGIGVWNQDQNNMVWNWGAPDGVDASFADNDIVHFTRSGNVDIQGFVEVEGKVKPFGIIDVSFNSGKGDLIWYTKNGGSITGNAILEKRGTGHLIIKTENSFAGGTKLYDGRISVETLTGLGSGLATVYGGFLHLGTQGATNDVVVQVLTDTGKHSAKVYLAGAAHGNVTVKENATLNFGAGYEFTKGGLSDRILVEGNGIVNIEAGSTVRSHITLDTSDGSVNFVAGNGGTSLFQGHVFGTGSMNVLGGNHEVKEVGVNLQHTSMFEGTLNIFDGSFMVSTNHGFKTGNMTGGMLISNSIVNFEKLNIGWENELKSAYTTVRTNSSDAYSLVVGEFLVNSKAILNLEGKIQVTGQTIVRPDAEIFVAANSHLITQGKLYTDSATQTQGSGMVVINDGSTWNANGGFEICYIDAREGHLTIGSDSILRENGYFYAENIVYGTDKDGNILPIGSPVEDTPTLTICKGSEFWAGNTTRVENEDNNLVFQTQTGFQCVELEIEELVTIGTFVTRGNTVAEGEKLQVTHEEITESMKQAFTPFFKDEEGTLVDTRKYLYVLKKDVEFVSPLVKSNETLHVDSGSGAVVQDTQGTILNLDGNLVVNGIDYVKGDEKRNGTVTLEGGSSDLSGATHIAEGKEVHFIGSMVSSPNGAPSKTTEAEIKMVENSRNPNGFVLKVDTVQAAMGETTHITENSQVLARNFIIAGSSTILDNDAGKLDVVEEVTLEDTAGYKVGEQDRFGWVNMNEGDLDLKRSQWNDVTLGSYSETSAETVARIRLNEGLENTVDAKNLTIINNEEETQVTAGNTVMTDNLQVGTGSHLDVNGGQLQVRKVLNFDAGVNQTGRIELNTNEEMRNTLLASYEAPTYMNGYTRNRMAMSNAVQVNLRGDNNVGIMDSSRSAAQIYHTGFNNLQGYNSAGKDGWVFTLTDEMLENQHEGNALAKIAQQEGRSLDNLIFDTSELTKTYFGDIQVYSDNITLECDESDINYGEATGTYNNKDAIKNFRYVNPLVPEVADITINSLWTMVSAMDTYSSAIFGQLDFSPYRRYLSKNIWAKAIYLNENIGQGLPGYRKDSGGYAVGADTNLNDKNLIGVSFAQMLGTENTLRGMAEDEQDILMMAVYGRHLLEACDKGSTTIDYMVGYGRADNDAKFFKNNKHSSSNWNSNVYDAEVKVNWYRKVSDNIWVNPFAGLEFIAADHESHSIRGAAGDFEVSRSKVHALRMPIGATVEYVKTLDQDSSLTPYIGASYIPDILRRNPSADVTNGMLTQHVNDTTVGRNAVRVHGGCTWKINKEWLVNANYEVETASKKANQSGRLSVNYTF